MADGTKIKDLEELRTFAQIVDSGSMTAAGRALGVPINVVSRRLARLEERVGVPLAQRTTRKLHPTEEGRRLHRRAKLILAEVESAEAELRGIEAGVAGELRLSVPTQAALLLRAPLLDFLRTNAGIDLQLFVTDRPAAAVAQDIVAHGLDAGLLVGPLPPLSIVTRSIGRVELRLGASPSYVERYGRPRRAGDLREHQCLLFIGDQLQATWRLLDRANKEHSIAVRGRLASTDSRVLRQAMLDGLGIGVAMPEDFAQLELVPILPSYRLGTLELRLGYVASRRSSPRVEVLASLLKEALGPDLR